MILVQHLSAAVLISSAVQVFEHWVEAVPPSPTIHQIIDTLVLRLLGQKHREDFGTLLEAEVLRVTILSSILGVDGLGDI